MVVSRKSILNWLTEPHKALRSIVCLSVILIPFVGSLLILPSAQALTISSPRDCDSNAVINCGALTTNELQRKFNNQSSVRTIFSSFGISGSEIRAMDSTAVAGSVTSSGNVFVNGKKVATNAMTAGRQNMSGSQRVQSGNTTFFRRPPSVSFAQSSLPAFVVMNNGRFQFAIIASCGNPVTATSVKKEKKPSPPPAAPTKPTPTPKTKAPVAPAPQQSQSQQQAQSQNVTVTTPIVKQPVAAAPQPQPTPAPQKGPTQLPATGAGDVIGLGSLVALAGGSLHYLYKRRFSS